MLNKSWNLKLCQISRKNWSMVNLVGVGVK